MKASQRYGKNIAQSMASCRFSFLKNHNNTFVYSAKTSARSWGKEKPPTMTTTYQSEQAASGRGESPARLPLARSGENAVIPNGR